MSPPKIPTPLHPPTHYRAVLLANIEQERAGISREEDQALWAAVHLFIYAYINKDPQDILLLWQTKRTSMDLNFVIDVQLLCGIGYVETCLYLQHCADPQAEKALAYLQHCYDAGDFEGFSPERQIGIYQEYFGASEL